MSHRRSQLSGRDARAGNEEAKQEQCQVPAPLPPGWRGTVQLLQVGSDVSRSDHRWSEANSLGRWIR